MSFVSPNSKYHEAYYLQLLENHRADSVTAKVFDIISDLSDRQGLCDVWEELDADIQDEIIDCWKSIISHK